MKRSAEGANLRKTTVGFTQTKLRCLRMTRVSLSLVALLSSSSRLLDTPRMKKYFPAFLLGGAPCHKLYWPLTHALPARLDPQLRSRKPLRSLIVLFFSLLAWTFGEGRVKVAGRISINPHITPLWCLPSEKHDSDVATHMSVVESSNARPYPDVQPIGHIRP